MKQFSDTDKINFRSHCTCHIMPDCFHCTCHIMPDCFHCTCHIMPDCFHCTCHIIPDCFHCTCHIMPDCFHGFCKLTTMHISRTWIEAAPKKFSVSCLPTNPSFLEKDFFLPNILPPLFQSFALFLAVAVLGMCSQTTSPYMHVHASLASFQRHLYTIKVWSEMGVLHCCSTSGGYRVVGHGQNFKVKKKIEPTYQPCLLPPWRQEKGFFFFWRGLSCSFYTQL